MLRSFSFLFVLPLAGLLFVPQVSLAQFTGDLLAPGLAIELSPSVPKPGQEVEATLSDYSSQNFGSTITWTLDGVELEGTQNQRNITFTAGALGSAQQLTAVLNTPTGGRETVSRSFTPQYLDIVFEAQTYVPPHYEGRALPSVGSMMNATALVNDGSVVNPANYTYTWQIGQDVLNNGSIRGGNQVSFPMPLSNEVIVRLTVRHIDGTIVGSRVLQMTSVSPELHFYRVSSLYGLSARSLDSGVAPIVGNSLTIQGVPYYLDIRTYNNPDILEWSLNGNPVSNNSNNPYTITLEGNVQNTRTNVGLHVRSLERVTQGAIGRVTVSN